MALKTYHQLRRRAILAAQTSRHVLASLWRASWHLGIRRGRRANRHVAYGAAWAPVAMR